MIQVNEFQFICMNLCVCYVSAMVGAWIYRATRRFYQECKERKEHKRISSNSVLEYLKCSESLECLNDIKIETEHARLTAECVPSTEIQRAEWRGRNEMVDRAIRIIDSRIEYEKRKADKRAELK